MFQVMLNTNVYGRPFDDLSSKEVMAEASAAYEIFILASTGIIGILTADVLFAEVGLIKDAFKRSVIIQLIKGISIERSRIRVKTIRLADILAPIIKDYMDSLHVAFAATGACDYLVTCDKQLLRLSGKIETLLSDKGFDLKIISPVDFVGMVKLL